MKSLKLYICAAFLFLISGSLFGQSLSGVKIHINPGHGGFDADDRGIPTPLIPNVGPHVGFWESQSNLDKGLQLKEMLETLGAEVQMSRTTNNPTVKDADGKIISTDDTPLSQIVRMANEFKADFMLSIHSNAGAGVANYVLMLYAGISDGDTHTYPTATPKSDESKAISTEIAKNLIKNQLTNWTSANYNVSGDKTYARMHMGWPNGYGVLRGLTVPGVISEGSMHDYIPETYRLMNMEYKWLEAWNFKKAFVTYFSKEEIPTGVIAGWVKDSRNLILDGSYRKHGKDVLLPLDGAKLTILETDEVYTVDAMRNGVYVFKDLQPGTYTLRAEVEGYTSQEQKVEVLKNEIAYFNFELNKVRNTPPEVTSYSPNVAINDSVETSTDIVLEFNWDMDEESVRNAFSITPTLEGDITFEDSQHRMRFRPHFPMERSTVYTVKLDKSAKHPANISMVDDFSFQFTTKDRNRLKLIASYPNVQNRIVHADAPGFRFVFDKKMNTSTTTRNEIKVYDAENKEVEKASRSILWNKIGEPYGDVAFDLAKPLTAGNRYTVELGGEVKDATGVKLVEPIKIEFLATDVTVADKTVIQEFETDGIYTFDESESTGVIARLAKAERNSVKKLFGNASNRVTAKFDANEAWVTFRTPESLATTEIDNVFGLHVYGDMSGNELQLQLTFGAEVKYLKLCDLTFAGWNYVEAKFEADEAFLLTGLRVERKEGILSESIDIYIDNLLQYDKLISGLTTSKVNTDDIQVYPNPASDVIHIAKKTDQSVERIELYTLAGQLIRSTQEDSLLVPDISSGTYIVKVKLNDGVVAKPVIIKK